MEGGERNRIVEGLDASSCPIEDCGAPTPRGYWLPDHWREVPDLLKSECREAANDRTGTRGGRWYRWLDTAVAIVRHLEATEKF